MSVMKRIMQFAACFCSGLLLAVSPLGVSVSKNASELDKFAAEELVGYLSKLTGETFVMVPEALLASVSEEYTISSCPGCS